MTLWKGCPEKALKDMLVQPLFAALHLNETQDCWTRRYSDAIGQKPNAALCHLTPTVKYYGIEVMLWDCFAAL